MISIVLLFSSSLSECEKAIEASSMSSSARYFLNLTESIDYSRIFLFFGIVGKMSPFDDKDLAESG